MKIMQLEEKYHAVGRNFIDQWQLEMPPNMAIKMAVISREPKKLVMDRGNILPLNVLKRLKKLLG